MARVQIQLDFMFKSSPATVYLFVTQPTCMVRWFCDRVDNIGDRYYFDWEGDHEEATLSVDIEEELVKYDWLDREGEFLQFRIYKTDITNETILEVTDFCDDDEVKEQRDLWEDYIKKLKNSCGG
ncbi:MAG: activator of HSP90 ATPase 1 family protein [Saprospiraceae bacterium]|nr:activator of HSP90 ATPase 1 family protein [Saprospiraceae bacterium]